MEIIIFKFYHKTEGLEVLLEDSLGSQEKRLETT